MKDSNQSKGLFLPKFRVELSDELEEYRMVEAKMTEIGSMVSYFIDELVSQHADIVSIHENVEISYDNLETGNEELIKAIERNKNGRRRERISIFDERD